MVNIILIFIVIIIIITIIIITIIINIIIIIIIVIGPDRCLHPSAIEAAALQANVLINTAYAPAGDLSFAVRNKRSHTNLSDVTITVSLCSDVSPKGFVPKAVKIGMLSCAIYANIDLL